MANEKSKKIIHHKRNYYASDASGSEAYCISDVVPEAEGAKELDLALHLYNVGTNARARVLYAPSGDGAYFASASQVISLQTSAGVTIETKTSDLGAKGRVILAVSDSTGSGMVTVEAEVIGIWKGA